MEKYTKYEKARIVGARALQIAMGAPILIDRKEEFNPVKIARLEFEEDAIPITVTGREVKSYRRTSSKVDNQEEKGE